MRFHGSHGQVGDVLFSHEDGRTCHQCGWATFWARGGDFAKAVCERCGARQGEAARRKAPVCQCCGETPADGQWGPQDPDLCAWCDLRCGEHHHPREAIC